MTRKRTRTRRCRFQRQEQLLGIEAASLVLPSIVGHRQVTSWFSTLILVVIIDITFSSLSSRPSSIDFTRTTPLLFHHSAFFVVSAETADDDSLHHCPSPDEAFITTCSDGNSGGNSGGDENLMDNNDRHGIDDHDLDADKQTTLPEISLKDDDDDGFDLVDEDLSEGIRKNDEDAYHQKEKAQTKVHYDSNDVTDNNCGHLNDGRKLHEQQQSKNDGAQSQEQQSQQQQIRSDGAQQQQQQSLSGGTQSQHQQQLPPSSYCNTNASFSSTTTTTSSEDNEYSVYHQLKKTTATFVHRHYNPLPQRGKCAIGSACGLLASRLSLGVANRIFRVAGATWVFSEAMHASGLCGGDDDDDETSSCAIIPEEARPWIRILRRSIGQKVENIRTLARKLWNKERIRELARQDEALAFGLAAGAFIGFII